MKVFNGSAALLAATGTVLGSSEWLTVDQDRVNVFAEATGDFQWIHVDTERATGGPFGTTIAHGYLMLSLVLVLLRQLFRVDGCACRSTTAWASPVSRARSGRVTDPRDREDRRRRTARQRRAGHSRHRSGARGRREVGMRGGIHRWLRGLRQPRRKASGATRQRQ